MANFPLYFGGGGIGFGGEIPSAWVDLVDAQFTAVPNAASGSSHTASSPVSIGGAGIVAPGAFYASGATIVIPVYAAWQSTHSYSGGAYATNGGHLYFCTVGGVSAGSGGPTGTGTGAITDGGVTWSYVSPAPTSGLLVQGTASVASGGVWEIQAGGFGYVRQNALLLAQGTFGNPATIGIGLDAILDVELGGVVKVEAGGLVDVLSSGTTKWESGGQLVGLTGSLGLWGGTFLFADGGAGSGAATLTIGDSTLGVGHLLVQGGGDATFGGTGSGSLKVVTGGAMVVSGSGSTTWQTGTSLTTLTGCTVTLGGTVALSGATTQTGVYTKSNYTIERVITFTTSQPVTPSNGDLYLYAATGNPSVTLTLNNPVANGIRVRVAASNTPPLQASGTLTITNAAPTTIGQLGPGTGGSGAFTGAGFADYESIGGAWICVGSIQGG